MLKIWIIITFCNILDISFIEYIKKKVVSLIPILLTFFSLVSDHLIVTKKTCTLCSSMFIPSYFQNQLHLKVLILHSSLMFWSVNRKTAIDICSRAEFGTGLQFEGGEVYQTLTNLLSNLTSYLWLTENLSYFIEVLCSDE